MFQIKGTHKFNENFNSQCGASRRSCSTAPKYSIIGGCGAEEQDMKYAPSVLSGVCIYPLVLKVNKTVIHHFICYSTPVYLTLVPKKIVARFCVPFIRNITGLYHKINGWTGSMSPINFSDIRLIMPA